MDYQTKVMLVFGLFVLALSISATIFVWIKSGTWPNRRVVRLTAILLPGSLLLILLGVLVTSFQSLWVLGIAVLGLGILMRLGLPVFMAWLAKHQSNQ
ncbi:MAG TPA: hypothetical protein VFI02_08820, partial [Armatimonadota bacterium]|nr:hypothetical protein [Armatimonadota bacterium]